MNIRFSYLSHNIKPNFIAFRSNEAPKVESKQSLQPEVVSVYSDYPIKTKPAQLSLFALHDFHGQDIKMEQAYTISKQFDSGHIIKKSNFFTSNMPVDKLKLASGDMFLGENKKELRVVNEFLNIAGIMANAVGNHECDNEIKEFAEIVKDRKYKFLAANMHPNKDSAMNSVLSGSFILESNGNKYGVIGLAPVDIAAQMKRPEEVKDFNVSDLEGTIKDLEKEIESIKKQGVNKIILLSHLGYEKEKQIAKKVSDIDIILGGHTHNMLPDAQKGENLITSPNGEPVLIIQVGRDGKHVAIPNFQFNELGQITKVQYNVLKTDDYERSPEAREAFEKILGKPTIAGRSDYVEAPPKDIYATENPHCDFILDCMRKELKTDIAIMNSANIRGKFPLGNIDTRDLAQISPFGNKVTVIRATEEEIVEAIEEMIEESMESPVHRPGILQVSGLRYEYSQKEGELKYLAFIDKNGKEIPIDIENPRENKFYTIASDDYCITSSDAGLDLKHRYKESIARYDCDKDKIVKHYLEKQTGPVQIKSDGRIKIVD